MLVNRVIKWFKNKKKIMLKRWKVLDKYNLKNKKVRPPLIQRIFLHHFIYRYFRMTSAGHFPPEHIESNLFFNFIIGTSLYSSFPQKMLACDGAMKKCISDLVCRKKRLDTSALDHNTMRAVPMICGAWCRVKLRGLKCLK
jgi:hypothetical protein